MGKVIGRFRKAVSVKFIKCFLLVLLGSVLLSACHQVTLRIEELPPNTPPNANIYVAGNFNNWYAGDRNFRMEKDSGGTYSIVLPKGSGMLKYKLTRGDWNTVETDECGAEIAEREIKYENDDTISVKVLSWKDLEPLGCRNVTFVVRNLPHNTPINDSIAIVGTFNNWQANDPEYFLKKKLDGTFQITLNKTSDKEFHEYKFSRGDLSTLEADDLGNTLHNRKFRFGAKDTIFVDIASWEDLYGVNEPLRTVIIKRLPKSTPPDAKIYLAGNLNGWYPRDETMLFRPDKRGRLVLKFPKNDFDLEFKITRGDWSNQEVDKQGLRLENRSWPLYDRDTLYIDIDNWSDKVSASTDAVTVVLDNIPENTPKDAKLYLAGNFNDWKTGDPRFMFRKNRTGKHVLKLRKIGAHLQFKCNRGSDATIEVNRVGNNISGRLFRFGMADSIRLDVANWLDLADWKFDKVTIVLLKTPKNTPEDCGIYLAGNFNNWNPKDERYRLKRNRGGEYYITLPRVRNGNPIRFKFTRGSKDAVEVDEFGLPRKPHRFNFAYSSKVYLEINGWSDL